VAEVVSQSLTPGEVAEAGPEAAAEAAGAVGKSLVVMVKKKVQRKVCTEISEKVWPAAYSISLQIQNLQVINKCNQLLMAWISKRSEAIESFDTDVFFYIEAKRTRSIVWKLISKRSKHVYIKEFKYRSEAKQVNVKLLI
jgi:hypothetical protein